MTGATVDIRFADVESEREFLESYLPEAFERYSESSYWEHGWFWPYGGFDADDIGREGGLVRLVFDGDPDQLLAAEGDRWAAFDGLVDWELTRYDEAGFDSLRAQQIDAKGAVGGEWEYRYKPLTARLALAHRETFDERLPPAPEPTDDNPVGIGMFGLVHALFVQSGYDWYEENDTYLRGLESRIQSIAMYRGADAARAEYERIRASWDAFEAELEEWLEDQPTGTASV